MGNIVCPVCKSELMGPYCHMCGEHILIKTEKEWKEMEEKVAAAQPKEEEEKTGKLKLLIVIALLVGGLCWTQKERIGKITQRQDVQSQEKENIHHGESEKKKNKQIKGIEKYNE